MTSQIVTTLIAESDQGNPGQAGSTYTIQRVRIYAHGDRYRARIAFARGSNQGYQEEHSRIEDVADGADLDEVRDAALVAIADMPQQVQSELRRALRGALVEARDYLEVNRP